MSVPTPAESSSLESRLATLERVRRVGWWLGGAVLVGILLVVAAGAAVHAGDGGLELVALLAGALLGPVAFAVVAVLDA